ncbi:hypothetical protein C8R42DRAFT_643339 [Lentinula raphanica]|nr:hypothetical protein C8R42DRAFT_643339 [Lentinula raphanica]
MLRDRPLVYWHSISAISAALFLDLDQDSRTHVFTPSPYKLISDGHLTSRRASTKAKVQSEGKVQRFNCAIERRKKRKYEKFIKEVAAEYEAESKIYKTLLPYQQIGLYAPRYLTLYWNIAAILNAGLERETMQMKAKTRTLHAPNCEESSDDDESDLDEDDLAERAHLLTIYDKIASTFASVVERLLKSANYDDTGTSYLHDLRFQAVRRGLGQTASSSLTNSTSIIRTRFRQVEGINSNRECFHDIPTTAEAPANDSGLTSLFTESSAPEDDDSKDDDSDDDDSEDDDSDDDSEDDNSEDDRGRHSEDDDDPQGNLGVNELGGGEDNGGQGNRGDGGQGYIGDDDDFDDDGDGSGGNEVYGHSYVFISLFICLYDTDNSSAIADDSCVIMP